MKKLILDSSFVIDYLKDRGHATSYYERLEEPQILISALVKMEVKRGSRQIGKFDQLDTVPFDDNHMDRSLDMINFLKRKGEIINKLDILIAAQSSQENAKLVTTDQDFEKLQAYEGFQFELVE